MKRILPRLSIMALMAPAAFAPSMVLAQSAESQVAVEAAPAQSGAAVVDMVIGDTDLSIDKSAEQSLLPAGSSIEPVGKIEELDTEIKPVTVDDVVDEVDFPEFSSDEVLKFGAAVAPSLLTFTVAEYDDGLKGIKDAFAHPEGWDSFELALANSAIPDFLRQHNASSSSVLSGDATITALEEDVPSWELVAPLKTTYATSAASSSEDLILRMKLIASADSETPVIRQVIVQRP